jgi:redox-sensitive bicupin YhaK (pirin superfamily)
MSDVVLQVVPLGPQWPCVDPFLFCAHHDDAYPAGTADLGPAAALAGRDLGQDFAGVDGWRMYHGLVVPGFPAHPHRGFETVTYVRHGLVDHSDSLGAAARFGRGDVQWLTAGGGIVHAEMFPLVDPHGPNPLELFQIWLNLPAEDKLVPAHFAMLWGGDLPRVAHVDDAGRRSEITVVAGPLEGATPPAPPPHSWAARPEHDVAIWHVRLDPGATTVLPPARDAGVGRVLYAFDGGRVRVEDQVVPTPSGVAVRAEVPVTVAAAGATAAELLVLQGRPIGEPVAQHGPFVMNHRHELAQAVEDYQRTGFGGWPHDREDPVHGARPRFARHADGRVEEVAAPA